MSSITPILRRLIILPFLFVSAGFAQTADPQPLVNKALSAVGGRDKLLKIFRIREIFHFGGTPNPAPSVPSLFASC
jgi:hypothetical protein